MIPASLQRAAVTAQSKPLTSKIGVQLAGRATRAADGQRLGLAHACVFPERRHAETAVRSTRVLPFSWLMPSHTRPAPSRQTARTTARRAIGPLRYLDDKVWVAI